MKRILSITTALSLLGLLAACSLAPAPKPDPTRFYLLAPGPQLGVHTPLPAKLGELSIGLNTIQVPSYLEHVEIAIRTDANEIIYQPYARWSESLATSVQGIVALQFLQSPRIGQLHTMPFPLDQKRDYDIDIHLARCEARRDAEGNYSADFAAIIVITKGGSGEIVARESFAAAGTPWDGRNTATLVQALSDAATKLAAATLAAIPQSQAQ